MIYDAVVIGGGLTGNHAAYLLAQTGLKVAILEEHDRVGRPWFCTGIVGKPGFDQFNFPGRFIQQELKSAGFYSPSGKKLHVARPETQAYVLNRSEFDFYLSDLALKEGAELFCGTKCAHAEPGKNMIRITAYQGKRPVVLSARLCLLATGVNYSLHRRLGLGRPTAFLDSAQVEAEGSNFQEVEIYCGSAVSPTSFAWSVPLGPDRVRIGVTAFSNGVRHLQRLLALPSLRARLRGKIPSVSRRVIPIGAVKKSYAERVMAVGDAAGQVKPTTGGGIYYGLLCSGMAAEVAQSAFAAGDFSESRLGDYQGKWEQKIGLELKVGLAARKLLAGCSDDQIDRLFDAGKEDWVLKIIRRYADFDWHRRLILIFARTRMLMERVGSLY